MFFHGSADQHMADHPLNASDARVDPIRGDRGRFVSGGRPPTQRKGRIFPSPPTSNKGLSSATRAFASRGLRKCFGLKTAVCTALVDNEVGRIPESLIMQGGADTALIKWRGDDGIGRTVRNGLIFTERGFGVRGAVDVMIGNEEDFTAPAGTNSRKFLRIKARTP